MEATLLLIFILEVKLRSSVNRCCTYDPFWQSG